MAMPHSLCQLPGSRQNANVLPAQWKLGIDADGNVAYERLRVTTNSVILEDSTGSTHEYGYKNGGYTPPVNEDGTLSKNADNTYTLADTDGRTYVFNADGTLQSVSSPTDDRQPAALHTLTADRHHDCSKSKTVPPAPAMGRSYTKVSTKPTIYATKTAPTILRRCLVSSVALPMHQVVNCVPSLPAMATRQTSTTTVAVTWHALYSQAGR